MRHSIEVLQNIDGISFNFFQAKDVVRHPVVGRIVEAYESYEQKMNREKQQKKQLHNQTQVAADAESKQ